MCLVHALVFSVRIEALLVATRLAHVRFIHWHSGILAAIFWFPLGIGCCMLDRKVECARCGMVLDEGLCG